MPQETRRKLIKFSNYSFCLTLPKSAIDQLGWGKGDEVNVAFDENKQIIIISKPISKDLADRSLPEPVNASNSPKLRW